MPPHIKITEEEILDTSIRIVREKGMSSLNARELAKELGCSVHPVFRTFQSMDGLKKVVYEKAECIYNQVMQSALEDGDNGFQNMGIAYIKFAKNEKNLFQMLFMSDAFQERNVGEIAGTTEGDDEVIAMLCQSTGLRVHAAQELYTGVWLTTHGIASMYATNSCRFQQEEIERLLDITYEGLLLKLKQEEDLIK